MWQFDFFFPLLIINICNTCYFTRNFCFKYWMTKFSQMKEASQLSIHQTAMLAHKEFFEAAILIWTATIKFHNPSSKFFLDSQIRSKTFYCKSGQPQNSSNTSEQNLNTSHHWAFLKTGEWPTWTSFLKKCQFREKERWVSTCK